jgi:hypothetical protein
MLSRLRVCGLDDCTFQELFDFCLQFKERVADELSVRYFLYVPSEKFRYYDSVWFGLDTIDKFPSILFDIKEAGSCFALGKNTASVFHLMRVLECGLNSLARYFSIDFSHTNWHPIIEQIESKVRDMAKSPNKPANWKDEQEFFSQCASYLMVVKDAWRNYTAHMRGKYDENEAECLLINVRAFMQKLSTKLSE